MVVLCRPVVVVLFWLPALRSNLSLCMCRPVYACVVSMTVPVSFIAITVLVLIDLLTVLRCGCPRVTDECSFFFPIPLPEGKPKGDPRKGWRKNDQSFLFFYPTSTPIALKLQQNSELIYYRDETSYKLVSWSFIFHKRLTTLVIYLMFYFPVMKYEPLFKWEISHL